MEKLKKKVASSSSRVMASIQQAATGTFQQQNFNSGLPARIPSDELRLAVSQAPGQQPLTKQVPLQLQLQQQQPAASQQAEPPAGSSASRLMAVDATAHLTEKEREILLEVFKKEEQFQRDTIKQMSALRALQARPSRSNEIVRDFQQQTGIIMSSGRNCSNVDYNGNIKTTSNKEYNNHRSIRKIVANQSGSSHHSSSNNSSFASARSPTPLSRPGSSAFGTPTSGLQLSSSAQLRTASSCSTVSSNPLDPLGQCRICRKFILANETCHLCSNCNQFICEDCASYSATEQHWMCSSCRRRATKPAIPADALKELGLNQNSSAVRRMTLRLNQNDLKMVLNKGSGESTASSNSSSGCSSMSTVTNQIGSGAAMTLRRMREVQSKERQHKSQCHNRHQIEGNSRAIRQPHQHPQQQSPASADDIEPNLAKVASGATHRPSVQLTAQLGSSQQPLPTMKHCDMRSPNQQKNHESRLGSTCNDFVREKASSQKTFNLQDSDKGLDNQQQQLQSPRVMQKQKAGKIASQFHGRNAPTLVQNRVTGSSKVGGRLQQQQQQQQQQEQEQQRKHQARRASVTNSQKNTFNVAAPSANVARKQSMAFTQNSANFQRSNQEPSIYYGISDIQQQIGSLNQFVQPQTMVTASSEASVDNNSMHDMMARQQRWQQSGTRRDSIASQQYQTANTTLIPIPPDQIHLRRLSDQSSLVRRSSIIADTIDSITMARNRSHSNIDTVTCSNYFYQMPLIQSDLVQQQQQHQQQQYGYSDENIYNSYGQLNSLNVSAYSQHQRRPSAQWAQQQHVAAQQEKHAFYIAQEYQKQQQQQHHQEPQHQQQQQQQPTQQISSIITSYAQKHGHSSEEIHSDSSSDIEEDARVAQTGQELENEQPNEYFAPPRALSATIDYMADHDSNGMEMNANLQAPISIPSVSVSEFSPNQQRFKHQMHQPEQYDQIISTPMQINVAIEQAIQQQQQQQLGSALLANELLPGQVYLAPRRGLPRSGRVLPKIPGEQSRSLLDLPQHNNDNNSSNSATDQHSMLDLPCLSPTIRRASAPEGQNIKIVVDDIDGCIRGSGIGKQNRSPYGKQGGLYERLVLYRDDSLDPNTNMARGFGLNVMGGKIDEDDKLQACVTWTLPGGPADKVGLKCDDKIIEWDGKCLVNMTYEQVADVIESSANIAELLVKPAHKLEAQPGANNYVRSQRRMSQQTEKDLKMPAMGHFEGFLPNGSRGEWGQSNNIDHKRHQSQHHGPNTSSQHFVQQPMAVSLGNSPQYSRTGTGRRLPQIPGMMMTTDGLSLGLTDFKQNSSSTSQLEHTGHQFELDGNHLSALHHEQQQSHSVGELYNTKVTSAYQQSMANIQNAPISHLALNPQSSGSRWQPQSGSISQNGYHHFNYLTVQDEICGLIGLQVNVDERVSQLEICVLSAINIDRNPSLDYYVRVKILPESNRFKTCTTQPSSDMNWKETFLFQNFPTQEVQRMALEIGIWVYDEVPRLSTQIAQPICEALIPIQSARERNTDFWPLRPPPTSPQARRKSLNDLIVETHSRQYQPNTEAQFSTGHQITNASTPWLKNKQSNPSEATHQTANLFGHKIQAYDIRYQSSQNVFDRERSSSNRNLPETSKLRAQPRRASDEVAGTSSHKLGTPMSPASGRRSISVMNVGDGQQIISGCRPASKLGSQSNILKGQARRDSCNQQLSTSNGSPVRKYTSPKGSVVRVTESHALEGVTPSGRRSSLAGIQSMSGYKSQKSSQSDATDQESPLRSVHQAKRSQPSTPKQSNLLAGCTETKSKALQQHRASIVSVTSTQLRDSEIGSRRCSTDQPRAQLQRKGSFAMLTFRKLKRTMSLTKGTEQDQPGSNQESRRSSSSSTNSDAVIAEDLGVTRRIANHTDFVGKLKLSFTMTKGQLEVNVIVAQGLRFDRESSIGIYVKMYLEGKNQSHKRKTRTVQAWDSPTFKQLIKYDGSLVDNKLLEVSVWQKHGGLRGKTPIGFTEIRLNELNLGQLQTSWYHLRSMDVCCSSSIED